MVAPAQTPVIRSDLEIARTVIADVVGLFSTPNRQATPINNMYCFAEEAASWLVMFAKGERYSVSRLERASDVVRANGPQSSVHVGVINDFIRELRLELARGEKILSALPPLYRRFSEAFDGGFDFKTHDHNRASAASHDIQARVTAELLELDELDRITSVRESLEFVEKVGGLVAIAFKSLSDEREPKRCANTARVIAAVLSATLATIGTSMQRVLKLPELVLDLQAYRPSSVLTTMMQSSILVAGIEKASQDPSFPSSVDLFAHLVADWTAEERRRIDHVTRYMLAGPALQLKDVAGDLRVASNARQFRTNPDRCVRGITELLNPNDLKPGSLEVTFPAGEVLVHVPSSQGTLFYWAQGDVRRSRITTPSPQGDVRNVMMGGVGAPRLTVSLPAATGFSVNNSNRLAALFEGDPLGHPEAVGEEVTAEGMRVRAHCHSFLDRARDALPEIFDLLGSIGACIVLHDSPPIVCVPKREAGFLQELLNAPTLSPGETSNRLGRLKISVGEEMVGFLFPAPVVPGEFLGTSPDSAQVTAPSQVPERSRPRRIHTDRAAFRAALAAHGEVSFSDLLKLLAPFGVEHVVGRGWGKGSHGSLVRSVDSEDGSRAVKKATTWKTLRNGTIRIDPPIFYEILPKLGIKLTDMTSVLTKLSK